MVHRKCIFLLVASLLLASTGVSADTTPPEWWNLQDNVTDYVEPGRPVNISAEFQDNDSGLEKTVLSINQSGSFYNYTKDPYRVINSWNYTFQGPSVNESKYNLDLDSGTYRIIIHGADGSDYSSQADSSGGQGGYLNGTFNASNGDSLEIWVGESPDYDSGGWGRHKGGEAGGSGGGGGGSTEVLLNDNILGVADGGGGAEGISCSSFTGTCDSYGGGGGARGGLGGNSSGGDGQDAEGSGFGGDGGSTNDGNPDGEDGGQEAGSVLTVLEQQKGGANRTDGFVSLKKIETLPDYVEKYNSKTNKVVSDFIWQGSNFTGTLGYSIWAKDNASNWANTETQTLVANQAPTILGTSLNWTGIGGNSERRVRYSISDPDGNEIGSHSTPPSGSEEKFTNTSYVIDGVDFPFDYTSQVTDFVGGIASSSTEVSTSDSGYQERTVFEHTIDSQRIERTAGITNNGDDLNYTLSMAKKGSVVQGDSWIGSLASGNSISGTSVWEDDYITGETEETYSKYSDGDYDHTDDSQRIHNRTKLLADNSRSFTFHNVDISNTCSRTSTADISAASGFLVTDDCNRPTFTGDWISETVSQEYSDSKYSHTLDTQKIEKNKTLSEDGGYSWSQVAISPPTVSGTCTDCSTRTRDISSLGSVKEVYHATSDWITGETLGTYNKYSDADFSHGEDTQRVHNRTELLVDNTRSFEFHGVDISGKCSQASSGNISSGTGVRVTDDCTRPVFQVDVINESTSTLFEDTGYSHSLSSQGVAKSKTLSETGGYDFIGVNVSTPALPGSVQNGGIREVNLSSGDSATEFYNSTGDWIQNEKEREHIVGQDRSQFQTVDVQQLYNQTRLEADNTRSFGFPAIDLSSTCSITQTAAVPSGDSTVTKSCNNESSSGDWIKNEESGSAKYASGPVFIGKGFNKSFTATQRLEAANVRTSTDLQVNVDSLVSDTPGCSVVNSSQQTFSADSVSSFTFHKSCNPGSHVNRTPVLKTESSDYFKYEAKFNFKVNSDLTEEQDFRYAVKKEWVDQWNSRDPTQTEVAVDGSSKDITIKETIIDGTEYIVFVIGDEHTNSSVHEGTHSASLRYFESKSPGSTSGSSGSSGGGVISGGSGSETPVEEVTSDKYNWSVSAITSEDSKSFQISGYPGATFEKYIVVRNTGDSNVTLDVDCVSLEEQCSWVDVEVDRVVLNRNSFSEKTIAVSGTVPESFSERDSPVQFSIQVSDPEFNGSQSGPHVGYVDFTVTDDPFLGRALDVALKGFEVREFESPVSWGHPVPYPFVLIPILLAGLVNVLWRLVEWLAPFREDQYKKKWSTNMRWITTLAVFLITFAVL